MTVEEARTKVIDAITAADVDTLNQICLDHEITFDDELLCIAENLGDNDIIEFILDDILLNGPDLRGEDHPTLLHWAISNNFPIAARYLANFVVLSDLEIQDSDGKTAMDCATEAKMAEVIELLKENS